MVTPRATGKHPQHPSLLVSSCHRACLTACLLKQQRGGVNTIPHFLPNAQPLNIRATDKAPPKPTRHIKRHITPPLSETTAKATETTQKLTSTNNSHSTPISLTGPQLGHKLCEATEKNEREHIPAHHHTPLTQKTLNNELVQEIKKGETRTTCSGSSLCLCRDV